MTGFLQGPDGNSSARLMALISLLAAIGFGTVVVMGKASPNADVIVYAFLMAPFFLGLFCYSPFFVVLQRERILL